MVAVACASSDPPAEVASVEPTTVPVPTAPVDAGSKPAPAPTEAPALVPTVLSVTPSHASVGSVGPTVVVLGDNFVPRSIVQLDGAPLATTFVSGSELRATLPTSKLQTIASLRISVGTSPPGGGASKEILFEVENPAPTLTALAPLSVPVGAVDTTLHATGDGFVPGTTLSFGGTTLPTTVLGPTSVEATVPASLLVAAGTFPVTVTTPDPGGGKSTPIAFTVTYPGPVVQSAVPNAAWVGAAATGITVNGSGFFPGSAIVWNGAALATTFVNAGQLTATVPASAFAAGGDFPVTVSNPPPGGGLSAPTLFRVSYPAPSVANLAPSTVGVGGSPVDVTVTGTGFYAASQITFDGTPATTSFLDGTHLKATLGSPQLATAGSILVRVANPAPGGGVSPALAVTVANPAPTLASLAPSSVTAKAVDQVVVLTGTGFLASSVVRSNGVVVASSYLGPTQVRATVPASQVAVPGTLALTVTNGAPGGGTSAARNLTVGCDSTGVDVSLVTLGTFTALPTNFATAATMARFTDSGACASMTTAASNLQPARYWVVQNMTGGSATLSAWADCTVSGIQEDAYLTFYRRNTPPANDAERLACVNFVAEGLSGTGGYSSPDRGASNWCPGLTKTNGGGVVLAACERAVVHMQAWSTTNASYPPPPTLKIMAE